MFIISPDSLLFFLSFFLFFFNSLFFFLSSGSFSTLPLSLFHPVLKLNWLFISQKLTLFFLFPSSSFFPLSDSMFLFPVFAFFSHEWEMRKLGKKCVKYMWKPGGGTVPTPAVLASNCLRSSPKDQEVVINVSPSGGWIPRTIKKCQPQRLWDSCRMLNDGWCDIILDSFKNLIWFNSYEEFLWKNKNYILLVYRKNIHRVIDWYKRWRVYGDNIWRCSEGNGYLLQYSCLENSLDRGAWWAIVHGVTRNQTWLSN